MEDCLTSIYMTTKSWVLDSNTTIPSSITCNNTKKQCRLRIGEFLEPFLDKFAQILKESKSGFLVGDGPTIADFDLFMSVAACSKNYYDHIDSNAMIEKRPALKAHMKKISSLEAVAEWYKEERKGGDGSNLEKKGMELVYFDFPGRAESIRLACRQGGVAFRDVRIGREQFSAMKKDGTLPFGQLPILFVDGVPVAQSCSLLRYVGKISKPALYPTDNMTAARIDSLILLLTDMKMRLAEASYPAQFGHQFDQPDATPPIVGGNTGAEVKERASSHLKGRLEKLDKIIKENSSGFVVGDKVTIADFAVFAPMELLMSGGMKKLLKPKKLLDATPALKAHFEKMSSLESVTNWKKKEHKDWDGSDLSKKGLQLLYFPLPGRTDCIRYSCQEGKVAFEDVRVPFTLFGKIKETTDLCPFGQLPVLLVEGKPIAQAHAVLRYIGKESGLYPCNNHLQAAQIDSVMAHMEDCLTSIYMTTKSWVLDLANTKESVHLRLCENFYTKVEIFDSILKKNDSGFLYGDSVTMADFCFHSSCVRAFDAIPALKKALEKYPNIKAHYEKISKNDAIVAYKKEEQKNDEKILKKGLELVSLQNVEHPLAWTLRVSGKSFRDVRLSESTVTEMKKDGTLPFAKLPVLFVNGEPITGYDAIARYAARLCDNNHIPSDNYDAAVVDSISDQCFDVFSPLLMYHQPGLYGWKYDVSDPYTPAKNTKKAVREALIPIFKSHLSKFESVLDASSSGYLVGDSPTVADVAFLAQIQHFNKDVLDYIDCKALLEEFPKARAHHDKMMKLDAISAYCSQPQKGDGSEIQKKGLELAYWYGGGRGIPIRLACALGNVTYRDLYIKGEAFKKAKADGLIPYGQMPVLFVDGAPIAQSLSILRYIGKIGGLYPTDDILKAAKVDMFLLLLKDMQEPMGVSMYPRKMGWVFD